MQEDRFDDKIRELLSSTHQEYDESSWEELNKKLDENAEVPSLSDDEAFIPIVKEKLQHQRSDVNNDHWEDLKSELDEKRQRRERQFMIKALEAAIVLLLFYTYFNYKSHTTSTEKPKVEYAQLQSGSPDVNIAGISIMGDDEIVVLNSLPSTESNNNPSGPAFVDSRILESVGRIQSPNMKGVSSVIGAGFNRSKMFIASLLTTTESTPSSELLEKLPIQALYVDKIQDETPSFALVNEQTPSRSYNSGWTVGLPFSYDVNFINTDINLGYLSNQIRSGLEGNSVGISVAYRQSNLEFESGIEYSEKTFVPGLLTSYSKSGVNSFLESQLDQMLIKQMQIPLLTKIYSSPNRKSSLYGVAGIAMNLITTNEYQIRRSVQPKARLAFSPATEVVDFKNLPQGLTQGGSYAENIYFTGVIGFGIESHIKNGISWYVQPQYQHSFTNDINLLVTKINSLNVKTGFRFSF